MMPNFPALPLESWPGWPWPAAKRGQRAGCSVGPQLAQTPPMGWNGWNKFRLRCGRAKNPPGSRRDGHQWPLKAAGYEHIVIDDCWHGRRDTLGFIQPDKPRFPSGMKALVDYVHGKELEVWHLLRRRQQNLRRTLRLSPAATSTRMPLLTRSGALI
ncbi:MAG: hypothetical protein WKG07_49165 [Hymenobacter sp.]